MVLEFETEVESGAKRLTDLKVVCKESIAEFYMMHSFSYFFDRRVPKCSMCAFVLGAGEECMRDPEEDRGGGTLRRACF